MAEVLRNPSSVVPIPVARRRGHEVRVGIFVILGVIAALTVLYEGTNPELLRSRQQLTTVVPDAGGLRKGDPVRMRGVNVGSIRGFRIVPGGVEIALDADPRCPIPVDSRIEIAPSSLLGEMRASIVPGKSPETVGPAATLPGSSQANITSAVGRLAGQTGQALDRLDELLSEQTVKNVQTSSAELAQVMGQLSALVAEQRRDLAGLTRSLRRSAQGIERAAPGPRLQGIMGRMDVLSARLERMADSLARSADSAQTILGRLENGQGALGRLTREDALYVNANQAVVNVGRAASEMAQLAQDVRQNPKKYVKLSLF